jgi:hypothetical protein
MAEPILDLADVRGQTLGRLAMEVAAAGAHHAALVGAPGVGQARPALDNHLKRSPAQPRAAHGPVAERAARGELRQRRPAGV